jgi:hypothetical protein
LPHKIIPREAPVPFFNGLLTIMQPLELMFRLPTDPELWIVMCYVVVVLIGARISELLARAHFAQARRRAEHGFEYVAEGDHYRCSEGERLSLLDIDSPRGIAVYQSPPDRCGRCPLKHACAPHADSRRMYRSLVTWSETDVGQFHRRVSLLISAAAAVLAVVGTWKWSGSPGTGYLLVGLLANSASLLRDLRSR